MTQVQKENWNIYIQLLKSNKASGPDGIPPGVFKLLNAVWLVFLVFILNTVFYALYPLSWTISKLFTIFKGGDSRNPGNYRGINIMNALPKLYDLILANRLQQWFVSDDEQAGAKKRSKMRRTDLDCKIAYWHCTETEASSVYSVCWFWKSLW